MPQSDYVTPGRVPTCDSAHAWWLYSAASLQCCAADITLWALNQILQKNMDFAIIWTVCFCYYVERFHFRFPCDNLVSSFKE